VRLQVHPPRGTCAEITREAQGGVGSDGTLAAHNLAYAHGGNANGFGQRVLGQTQRFHEIVEQDFAGMHRGKFFGLHKFNDIPQFQRRVRLRCCYASESGLLAGFRSTIRVALDRCVQHESSGTELPAAHFTTGHLRLLLGEPYKALHAFARGLRYCLAAEENIPCDALQTEIAWLHRVNPAKTLLELGLAQGTCPGAAISAVKTDVPLTGPVLIVAGGAASMKPAQLPQVTAFLEEALAGFSGTVISGGTTVGVPGCLGNAAKHLADANTKDFQLRGYIPRSLPEDAEKDKRYDKIIVSGADKFSPAQVLRGWQDVLAAGIKAVDVRGLGFGGGELAAFEYRLALALGATVGVVSGTGGTADELLKDPLWSAVPGLRLFPLPPDSKTLRAFVVLAGFEFDTAILEQMAPEFHARYRGDNLHKIKPVSECAKRKASL